MKTSSVILSCATLVAVSFAPLSSAFADVSSSDKSFIMKAAQGGMTEVEEGKLAQEKAQSQDVKDFGAMMVKDHTQNNSDLMSLAKTKGVDVPAQLDSSHQKMVDSMGKKSGAAFDKAYLKAQIADHKKMLSMMKSEQKSKDADLKDFSTKTADVVQQHLDKATSLQSSVK